MEERVERGAVAEEDVAVLVLRDRPRVLLELQRRQRLAAAAVIAGRGAGADVAAFRDETLQNSILLAIRDGNVVQERQEIRDALDHRHKLLGTCIRAALFRKSAMRT